MKRIRKGAINRFNLLFIFVIAFILLFAVIITSLGAYLFNLTDQLQINFNSEMGWFIVIIWFLVSIILGMVVSYGFAQIIMKPINEIINAMTTLSDGIYDISINLGKHHALKELSECFNKLANELKNNDMMSSEFINNFSHELKTPLVSISGLISLMKREDFPEEKSKEYLKIIEEEANRLASLTTNILSLSKLENQNIVTDKEKFNVSEQIRSCVLLLEKKWQKKNLELLLDFNEYYVYGNMDLLKQVWFNLLDNAIKFSSDNDSLIVNIFEEYKFICVEVDNKGELEEQEIEKIFHKFYQSKKHSHTEGNGIGLSIVKRIVELHNGTIEVLNIDGRIKFIVRLAK